MKVTKTTRPKTKKRSVRKAGSKAALLSSAGAVRQLVALYRRNGYARVPSLERRRVDGQKYKKGYEIRLVLRSKVELALARRWLKASRFEPGRPFEKGNTYRLPIYGQEAVSRFLSLVRRKTK